MPDLFLVTTPGMLPFHSTWWSGWWAWWTRWPYQPWWTYEHPRYMLPFHCYGFKYKYPCFPTRCECGLGSRLGLLFLDFILTMLLCHLSRFGHINSLRAMRDLRPGEEIFVHYGYKVRRKSLSTWQFVSHIISPNFNWYPIREIFSKCHLPNL